MRIKRADRVCSYCFGSPVFLNEDQQWECGVCAEHPVSEAEFERRQTVLRANPGNHADFPKLLGLTDNAAPNS